MNQHGDSILNIPLVIVLVTSPWLIHAIEEFSWLTGNLIFPVTGTILAILNIWYMIRKHKKLGGKD